MDIEVLNSFDRYCLRLFGAFGKNRPGTVHTLTDMAVINELYMHPGTNAITVASFLGIDRGYMTRIIEKLEKFGVVYRTASTRDRRSKDIFLTDKGRELAERLVDETSKKNRALLQGLSAAEAAETLASMEKIMAALSRNFPVSIDSLVPEQTPSSIRDALIADVADTYPGDLAILDPADGTLKVLYASPGLSAMCGMSDDEFKAATNGDALQVVVASDRPRVEKALEDFLDGSDKHDYAFRANHKELGFVWVHASMNLLNVDNGAPLLLAVFQGSSMAEAEHSLLLDQEDTIIYVVGRGTYELFYANKAALDTWKRDNLCELPCHQFVNRLDAPCPWCSIPLMENGRLHVDDVHDPTTDRWLEIDCQDIDWCGRPATAVFCKDVSTLRRRQRDLEIDRDSLQVLLEDLPVGIGVREIKDGKVAANIVNARACDLLGTTAEALSADDPSVPERVHPDDREMLAKDMGDLYAPGAYVSRMFRYDRDRDGNLRWYHLLSRSVDRNGENFIMSTISDATEEHRRDAELAKSRQMYESAVEEAKLVIWEYDIVNKRVIMSDNDFAEYDYRKFSLPKIIDNAPESLVPYIDDDSVDTFLDMYRKVQDGAPHVSCEVWYKLNERQEPRCEHISYTTVFDDEGRPISAYGIGQNITSQKLDEQKHERMYDDLAKANPNSLGTFRVNLTKNLCNEGRSPYPQVLEQQKDGTADGYFKAVAAPISDPQIKQHFLDTFNRKNLIDAFLKGSTQLSIEYPMVFSDGRLHWLNGYVAMAQNPATGDVEAVTYAIDATELVIDQAVTRFITERIYDYIGVIDVESGIFTVRTTGENICAAMPEKEGYGSFVGRLKNACSLAEDSQEFGRIDSLPELVRQLEEEGTYTQNYVCTQQGERLRKQIKIGWLDESHRMIIMAQADVTADYRREKQHVDELEAGRRALDHANLLLQNVLDTAPSAVFWKDADARFEGANKAFLDFYGFPSLGFILGKTDADMGWHPDPEPYANDELRVLRDGISTYRVPGMCEAKGRMRHIVASKRPRYENGKIVGLVGSFEDVTSEFEHAEKVAKLNIDLQHALDAAEKSAAAEQAFLSNMSHDMRTPLNGIIGFTDLARQTGDEQRRSDYLDKIASSGRLMLDLVNDVLDMSKIESGKFELRPEPIDSQGLMDTVVESIALTAEKGSVALVAKLDPAYPRFISADRLRLQQIALNLLSNAIKYTPAGGTVRFEIDPVPRRKDGCNTLIRVTDTGIGMSADFQTRMFEPFSQEHQSSIYGIQGTGLGLSIVSRIVTIMDGHIETDSALGEGTEFRVYLPIDIVDIAAPISEAKAKLESIKGKRILLCEDNDLNAEIAETVLRERGLANVERARDGREGLELFEASDAGYFDAVLMDLRMPVMGGLDATRAIRALDRADAKKIPIIAMTADAFAEDVRNCIDAGMNCHVSKPIDPITLIEALSEALGTR